MPVQEDAWDLVPHTHTLIRVYSAQLADRVGGAGPGSARAAKGPSEAHKQQGKAWKHEAGPGGLSPRLLLQSLPASVWTSLQDSTGEVLQAMTSAEGWDPRPQSCCMQLLCYTYVVGDRGASRGPGCAVVGAHLVASRSDDPGMVDSQ